jgi:16S rRNA G966 N2-methylase RsmD
VDRSKYAVTCIHHNADNTGLKEKSKIFKSATKRFLEEYKKFELPFQKFDIIFFAPPHKDYKEKILALTAPFLNDGGVVVAEHSSATPAHDRVGDLEKIEERVYGNTTLSFYRHI